MLVVGVNKCCKLQPDEFFAGVAVHRAGRKVGLDHEAGFQIGNDQPIGGGIEDAVIQTFFFFRQWSPRAFVHDGHLLLSCIT